MHTSASRSLEARARGRDNNLTLIRMIAALSVLVSHTFYLVYGPGREPMGAILGETPGSIAVEVFFVISGFLVTRSLMLRKSALDFVPARILRIFPGLIVQAVFAAVILGLFLSATPFSEYFASPLPLRYVLKTAILSSEAGPLPGVMLRNGSLWSLPLEVALYCMLLCAWIAWTALREQAQDRRSKWIRILGSTALFMLAAYWFTRSGGLKLAAMFGSGIGFYFLRHKVILSGRWAVLALLLVIASSISPLTFHLALICLLPYIVMCAAYLPRGKILKFNSIGDYSYGLYIYAFPIQVAVAHELPGAGVLAIAGVSAVIASMLAAISWHLVEKPSLNRLPAVSNALHRLTGTPSARAGSTH